MDCYEPNERVTCDEGKTRPNTFNHPNVRVARALVSQESLGAWESNQLDLYYLSFK